MFGTHIRSRSSSRLLSHCCLVSQQAASSPLGGVSGINGTFCKTTKIIAINTVPIPVNT